MKGQPHPLKPREPLRFIVVGDGFAAAETLGLLVDHESALVVAAYSTEGPGEPGGLSAQLKSAEIPHACSADLKSDQAAWDFLRSLEADWLININSTVLLPPEVLEIPKGGALNMHPGILPTYAGLHTHQWAIRNGDVEFGSTIHTMAAAVDTGDIVHTCRFPIGEDETGLSLFMTALEEGSRLMAEVVEKLLRGETLDRTPQDLSQRKLYLHRDALDGTIDWALTGVGVERFVRAGSYAPLSSPSYTPSLVIEDQQGQKRELELLRVALVHDDFEPEASGTFVLDGECPPLVFCGDGAAIEILEARLSGASRPLSFDELNAVLAPLDPTFGEEIES